MSGISGNFLYASGGVPISLGICRGAVTNTSPTDPATKAYVDAKVGTGTSTQTTFGTIDFNGAGSAFADCPPVPFTACRCGSIINLWIAPLDPPHRIIDDDGLSGIIGPATPNLFSSLAYPKSASAVFQVNGADKEGVIEIGPTRLIITLLDTTMPRLSTFGWKEGIVASLDASS